MLRYPPEFTKHISAVRQQWKTLTAFRIGLMVGEAGEDLPCPYTDAKRVASYAAGVSRGKQMRERQRPGEA